MSPSVVTVLGGDHAEIVPLTFASLPYASHPIDIAYGSQGWGPFAGQWTPLDFASAKDAQVIGGIDITWLQGDNRSVVSFSPSYDVLTLMQDKSLDLVNNPGNAQALQNSQQSQTNVNSSTVTNGGLLSGLRSIFGK